MLDLPRLPMHVHKRTFKVMSSTLAICESFTLNAARAKNSALGMPGVLQVVLRKSRTRNLPQCAAGFL